jgi:hypothetical protein
VFTQVHKNSGSAQIRDIVQEIVNLARLENGQAFNEVLLGDGTTVNAPEGVQSLVSSSPTSSLTVGGRDQATYSWWQNQVKASSGSAYDYLEKDLRLLWRQCSEYGSEPSVLVTDGLTYDIMEDVMFERQQFMDNGMTDMGWPNTLTFRRAPIVWDSGAEAGGVVRMMNTDDCKLLYDSGLWMVMQEWMKTQSNVNKVAHILSALAFVSRRRRSSGVLTGVSA